MRKFLNIIRSLLEAQGPNTGTRNLSNSILIPEVKLALFDWIDQTASKFCLIDGLALSFYVKPRTTQDVDLLFLYAKDIPTSVKKFKRVRPSAFQHSKTHVEIEVITPSIINMDVSLAQKIFEHSTILQEGIRIATPSGLVAAKLKRSSAQDKADIINLIKLYSIDISDYTTDEFELKKLENLKQDALYEIEQGI